jgi:23S rRNA (guanine745-N1)-methyltransferase
MPLSDCSVDVVFNAFSPLAIDEVRRVLRTGANFVMVYPGREHLFGLKSVIYKTPYKNEPQDTSLSGFKLVSHDILSYEIKLCTKEDIHSLFMMTPYAYRTSREDRERVLSLSEVSTEVEFVIDVYEKI